MYSGWYTPLTGFARSKRTPPPVLASERLMKGWEATGSFWRPETPDEIYWGTITFSPGAETTVVLEGNLFGAIASRPPLELSSLNGRLFNGALCSIFSCWGEVEFYDVGRQYFPRTRVFSHLSIIGGHWDTADACRFESLQIRFSHLDQWFGPPYDIRPLGDDLTEMLLSFKPPELNADFVFQGVNVDLKSFCSYSIPSRSAPEGAKWPYKYYLILRPENHQNVDWFCDLTSMLRELFVFLIGSGVYTLDIVGSSGNIEDNNIRMFQVDCPVAVPSVVRPELRYFSTRHHDYNDVLPSIIRAWFRRRTDLEITAKAYTELLCNDGASEENILLRIVQTLEHFHGVLWQRGSYYVEKKSSEDSANG